MRGDSIAISAELIDIKEIRPWMVLGTYFSPCVVGFISILAGYRGGAAPNPFLLVHMLYLHFWILAWAMGKYGNSSKFD